MRACIAARSVYRQNNHLVTRFILVSLCVWAAGTDLVLAQSKTQFIVALQLLSKGWSCAVIRGWFRAEGDGSGQGWVHYRNPRPAG